MHINKSAKVYVGFLFGDKFSVGDIWQHLTSPNNFINIKPKHMKNEQRWIKSVLFCIVNPNYDYNYILTKAYFCAIWLANANLKCSRAPPITYGL